MIYVNNLRSSLFLADGEVIDHHRPEVADFVDKALGKETGGARGDAVKLYYAVRDGIFYEIFGTSLGEHLSASATVRERRGFCLHKAMLYVAACRHVGIPARLLAAPVRNHISSPTITKLVGGDVFLHWFSEIELDGVWLKAAPIFNKLTCRLYGIAPLEFDGSTSAVEQPYLGTQKMIYLDAPVMFANPNREDLIALIAQYHPRMIGSHGRVPLDREIARSFPVSAA